MIVRLPVNVEDSHGPILWLPLLTSVNGRLLNSERLHHQGPDDVL